MKPSLSHSLFAAGLLSGSSVAQVGPVAVDINPNAIGITSDLNSASDGIGGSGQFVKAGGLWFFRAETLAAGDELFVTDGTPVGTALVCDLYPGSKSSSPSDFVFASGSLFFSPDNPITGTEVYQIPSAGPYVQDLGFRVSGTKLAATTPKLGGNIIITCEGVPAGAVSLLTISSPVAEASTLFADGGSASWMDPATTELLGFFMGTDWSYTAMIPAAPSLIVFHFNLQSYTLAGGSFPATTSNGLTAVVGS